MSLDKAGLRPWGYAARAAQSDPVGASRRIMAQLQALPELDAAATVLWYVDCRREVRTRGGIEAALAAGSGVVVPYCTRDQAGVPVLGLWRLEALDELVTGTWGIREPPPQRWLEPGRVIGPGQLDAVIVPGVAFDRAGGRLGNGQGYYDRLLAEVRADALLCGICYEAQLYQRIPMASHDIFMDWVVTEQRAYPGRGRQ